MAEWALPEDVLREAPRHTPRPHELADLELLLSGAYTPLTGFLGEADLEALTKRGRLADGTAWPVSITLTVPASVTEGLDASNPLQRAIVLTDPEASPIAAIDAREITETAPGWRRVGGPVRAIGKPQRGAFHRLHRSPAEVRELLPPSRVLGVYADRPLHRPQLAQIAHAARTIAAHVLVLVPTAGTTESGVVPEALVRCVLAARDRLPPATIATVPLAPNPEDLRTALLRSRVAAAYGVTHLLSSGNVIGGSGSGLHVVVPRELAYDSRDGQWRTRDDIPPRFRRLAMSPTEIDDLLDRGAALPEWHTPPAVATELRRARPPRRQRGLVLLFTGLSGAGKSTVARGVAAAIAEDGTRNATVLDGDVVRRFLSQGLTFSRADRETNVRRIGWVAAEVARHGGVAVCSPIAPYAATRAEARDMARAVGAGFVLIHVSTPIEVCEQRDRKGLYARARSGQVTGMTGVDDPYEEPTDADFTLDTSETTTEEAAGRVLDYLTEEGWLDLRLS